MKLLSIALVSIGLVAACGGASDTGGRDESVGADDDGDDDEGASDDDGAGDDDEGTSDDDAEDDDATADDDVPSGDDDAPSEDDDAPAGDDDAPTGDDDPPVVVQPVPTTPVTPIEGCEVIGQSASTTYCDISEQCSNTSKYTYCSQTATGTWTCQCQDNFGSRELEVQGDAAPCSDVAELCTNLEVPEFTGEETCSDTLQSLNTTYCESQVRCVQAEPLTDTVSVVSSKYRYSYCYDYGDGRLQCNCSDNTRSRSFILSDVALSEACAVGRSLCDEDAPVEPVGEETCTTNFETAGSGYCERQQTCSQTLEASGAQASLTETQYGYCQTATDGTTTCSCSGNSRSYSFELGVAADATACEQAISVCTSDEAVTPEGPVDCTLNSQSASGGSCSANVQCTQEATVEGVVIGINGSIYSSCQQNGDAFLCYCQSGSASVTIDVTAADAWGACTTAAEQCPEVVDVQIGSSNPCYGYPVRPPVVMTPAGASAAPPGDAIAIPCYR
jgi:hypothetical protein